MYGDPNGFGRKGSVRRVSRRSGQANHPAIAASSPEISGWITTVSPSRSATCSGAAVNPASRSLSSDRHRCTLALRARQHSEHFLLTVHIRRVRPGNIPMDPRPQCGKSPIRPRGPVVGTSIAGSAGGRQAGPSHPRLARAVRPPNSQALSLLWLVSQVVAFRRRRCRPALFADWTSCPRRHRACLAPKGRAKPTGLLPESSQTTGSRAEVRADLELASGLDELRYPSDGRAPDGWSSPAMQY